MMLRDLRLPNGMILEFGTDRLKSPEESTRAPLEWQGADGLAGNGQINHWTGTRQPFVGCPTGGDVVAEMLMRQLARERRKHREEGDDDARWNLLG